MDKNVNLYLEETPTIWLLDIPGSCVEKDSPVVAEIIQQNEMYKQMVTRKKVQNESFTDRGIQTLNYPPKPKEVQIVPNKKKEMGSSATEWDIFDSFNKKSGEEYVSIY